MMDSNQSGGGRRVVIAVPDRGNNYDVLTVYADALAAEFSGRGWQVSLARAASADFLPTLLAHAADPDAVALLGHFFYDLRVSAQNLFSAAGFSSLWRGQACAMWADHPFTGFMWPRMQQADPGIVYFAAEPGFIEAARLINPRLQRCQTLSLPVLYRHSAPNVPMQQRPIDVLVPLTFRKVGGLSELLAELAGQPHLAHLAQLAETLFAQLRHERHQYPLDVFLPLVEQRLGVSRTALAKDRQRMLDLFGVLSRVDLLVRNERRAELLTDLLADTAGLKVQVVGTLPADLVLPPGVHCEGPLDALTLGRRMAASRIVVHGQPTYPWAMHERVLTAMASACVVVSDPAPVLDATFAVGQQWLRAERGTTLASVLAPTSADDLAAIGERARDAVCSRFGIRQHVDALLLGLTQSSAA